MQHNCLQSNIGNIIPLPDLNLITVTATDEIDPGTNPVQFDPLIPLLSYDNTVCTRQYRLKQRNYPAGDFDPNLFEMVENLGDSMWDITFKAESNKVVFNYDSNGQVDC